MKKFISKKRRIKRNFIKYLLIVSCLIIFYLFFTKYILKIELTTNNEEFIQSILNDSNHYIVYETNSKTYLEKALKMLSNVDINNPITILERNLNKNIETTKVGYSSSDEEYPPTNTEYIEDIEPEVSKPIVYIYNTHQLENYTSSNLEDYSVAPSVLMASYILRESLNNLGISTLVETANITDFLNLNGWDYNHSYDASKYYLQEALKNNPSIKLVIDLHRDSIAKNLSTININDKNYAKVLFVVGLEHKNYNKNFSLANELHEIIKKNYPGLSRGIITKQGSSVNGIYNQDVFSNSLLIECGGSSNSIEEVRNTMDILAEMIKLLMEKI